MDQSWDQIVDEGLAETLSKSATGVVAGAKLSQVIKKIASSRGIAFPPEEYSTFRLFIESFPDKVIVQARPGRDILIVRADRADLLSAEPSVSADRIRDDLFKAFTRIAKAGATEQQYYLPDEDKIVSLDEDAAVALRAVKLPDVSLEQEVLTRKEFIESPYTSISEQERGKLLAALEDKSPLGAFTNVVRIFGLAKTWHRFRMAKMLGRLQKWSAENQIPWNSNWISQGEPAFAVPTEAKQVPTSAADMTARELLVAISKVITDAELSRVTVPLDLVARAWQTLGK